MLERERAGGVVDSSDNNNDAADTEVDAVATNSTT